MSIGSVNLKITSKVVRYFYRWKPYKNKIEFINILSDQSVIKSKGSKNYDEDRLFLLNPQTGQFLNKKQKDQINRAYALQVWMYENMGQVSYNHFHDVSLCNYFLDYLSSKDPKKLMTQINNQDLKDKVCDLLEKYSILKKSKKKILILLFLSKQKDSINVLNQINSKWPLKKRNYEYIYQGPNVEQARSEIEKILNQYVLNSKNQVNFELNEHSI